MKPSSPSLPSSSAASLAGGMQPMTPTNGSVDDQRLVEVGLAIDLGRLARPEREVDLPVGPPADRYWLSEAPSRSLVADHQDAAGRPGQTWASDSTVTFST